MASKTILVCDLCLNETTKEDLSVLSFKKPNKPINKYEVCSSCAEKLLTQIASNTPLNKDWSFAAKKPTNNQPLADAADENDDIFLRHQQRELAINGKIDGEWEQAKQINSGPQYVPSENKKCPHYNKSPVMKGNDNGTPFFFQKCKDCGKNLKPKGVSK